MPKLTKPRVHIDKEELAKWARAGANQQEIAARLGCSTKTLQRRLKTKEFLDILPKCEAELKISLKTKQIQTALAGNPAMLIWLGKQYLGQRDKWESEVNQKVDVNVDIKAAILSAIADLPQDTKSIVARRLLAIGQPIDNGPAE